MLKGRLEDDRMLTGRGKYVSDWNLPGQAYGHFVRSDRAHAEIVSIGKEETLAHPGVIGVFTGEDIKAALKSLRSERRPLVVRFDREHPGPFVGRQKNDPPHNR